MKYLHINLQAVKEYNLQGSEILLYALIDSFEVCYMSQGKMAQIVNLSRKTVNETIQSLISKNAVEIVQNFNLKGVTKGYRGCNERLHKIRIKIRSSKEEKEKIDFKDKKGQRNFTTKRAIIGGIDIDRQELTEEQLNGLFTRLDE